MTRQQDSGVIPFVNDKLTGVKMTVVSALATEFVDGDFTNINEEALKNSITSGKGCNPEGLSYAEVILRHGVANFVFRHTTGIFYALDEAGQELASGTTIKETLDSL